MTDDDASTIGTELALGNGLSDVIATLEPELAALGSTITASAVMLQELTQLGQRLNAFNANAAPIAVPSRDAHSSEAPAEHVRSEMSNRARAADAQGPGVRKSTGWPLTPAALTRASPRNVPKINGSLAPPRAVSRQGAPAALQERPASTEATPTRAPLVVIAPVAPSATEPPKSSPSPVVADKVARDAVELDRALSRDVGMPPLAAAPITVTSIIPLTTSPIAPSATTAAAPWKMPAAAARIRPALVSMATNVTAPETRDEETGAPAEARVQQIVLGAMAPGGPSPAASVLPPTRDAATSDAVTARSTIPSETTAAAAEQPTGSQSPPALAEPPQTESEPRQGTMVLDGALLGRWVIEQLERHASRPGAMTTGIDPRMNAIYPGAPTGA